MNGMTLELALKNELMTTVRLATGGVCSLAGLGLDDSEDCKVCVTESAIILKNCGFSSVEVVFGGEDELYCTLSGEGGTPVAGDNELSLALVSALVADCELKKQDGIIEKVTLKL